MLHLAGSGTVTSGLGKRASVRDRHTFMQNAVFDRQTYTSRRFVQRTYGPFLVEGANSWLCIREIDQKLDVTPGETLDADGKARFNP